MENTEKQVSGEEYRQMSVSTKVPKQSHKHTVNIPIVWIVAIIVIGVLSFFGGVHYEKHHLPKTTTTAAASGALGRGFGVNGGANSLRAFGTVSSVSSSSVTVENPRTSSSTTYSITSSTKITDDGQTVTSSDIQTGDTVIITKASASSSNATAIEVNPSFGGGFGGGASSPSSDTSPSSDSDSTTN
jgi:hypothetical protein